VANITACLSTGKDDWETPDDLFQRYNEQYHFVCDAAANGSNTKCHRWFGPGSMICEDAFEADWGAELRAGNIWLNPPYSKGLQSAFVQKAIEAAKTQWDTLGLDGPATSVVMLLPSRTDTKLFHDLLVPHCDIEFLRGRVKFVGAEQGAPFPSLIAVTKQIFGPSFWL